MFKRNTVKDYLFQIINLELKRKKHKKRKELTIISNKDTMGCQIFRTIYKKIQKFSKSNERISINAYNLEELMEKQQ